MTYAQAKAEATRFAGLLHEPTVILPQVAGPGYVTTLAAYVTPTMAPYVCEQVDPS